MPSRSEAPVARRRLTPEQRRTELLDAALDQLRALGNDCTVLAITQAASTAKGNFYRYFATWDDMLDAARERVMDDYRAGIDARLAAEPDGDWWTLLAREVEHYIHEQLSLGPLHDILFHRPGAAMESGADAPAIIQGFIAAGIAEGVFRPVDSEALGRLLFHTLHGAADDIAAGADHDVTLATLTDIVGRVLRP